MSTDVNEQERDEEQKHREEMERIRESREEKRIAREKAMEPARRARVEAKANLVAEMDDVYYELEQQHGDNNLRRIDVEDGSMIVVKRPAQVSFKRFQQSKVYFDDCDALIRTCLVYPNTKDYSKIIDVWPGLALSAANEACALAGVRAKESEGK